ncbi:MAG: hypothetical protein KGZ25_13200, partial [Planctomycetes bacterium]|nr:hypothetical protein [Planctomycetota bacterium]
MNVQRKVLLRGLLIVLVCAVGVFLVFSLLRVSSDRREKGKTQSPAGASKGGTPEKLPEGVISLKIKEQEELTPEKYAANPDRWVPERSPEAFAGETCGYNMIYDKERRILEYNNYGRPKDVPMLELRFRKEAKEGGWEKCLLDGVVFQPFTNGKTIKMTDKEAIGVGLNKSRAYPSIQGGYGCRVLVAETRSPENLDGILAMGHKYHMEFRQPGYETRYETPEKWGSKIIKIPENVPRGKVAIMEVDVTGK